jgi:hypothetical protein
VGSGCAVPNQATSPLDVEAALLACRAEHIGGDLEDKGDMATCGPCPSEFWPVSSCTAASMPDPSNE